MSGAPHRAGGAARANWLPEDSFTCGAPTGYPLIPEKVAVMRIAIPVWEDKISPVFDTALRLLMVEYDNGKERSRLAYHIGEEDLSLKCNRIKSLAPDLIICGAVSHLFLNMLKAVDVDVIEHVSGSTEDILEAYLKGDILNTQFLMPGCERQGHGCGRIKKLSGNKKHKINKENT